ncbi:MAG: hypothetical protein ACOC2Y_07325, partial [Spirochaetota bacterium]
AGREANLFVDSGLVVARADQGQAMMLLPQQISNAMGLATTDPERFADIQGPTGLSGAPVTNATALVVPNRTWRGFGDWSGMSVSGLLSWGYLKNYSWTIDFDRSVYLLGHP